jgi:predicted nucleic acid-binding protein
MMIFVDTSAFVALLDAADGQHTTAERIWRRLLDDYDDNELVSNNYVLLETCALVQRRYGLQVLRTFQEQAVPLLQVDWLGPEQHEAAMAAVLAANRRGLSLVDCASFETMRRLGIRTAFTFDPHFAELGYEVPGI